CCAAHTQLDQQIVKDRHDPLALEEPALDIYIRPGTRTHRRRAHGRYSFRRRRRGRGADGSLAVGGGGGNFGIGEWLLRLGGWTIAGCGMGGAGRVWWAATQNVGAAERGRGEARCGALYAILGDGSHL